MIAGCPKCGARYRIDAAKLGPDGARLRCTQCEAVFRVTPPAPPEPAAEPVQARVAPEVAPAAERSATREAAPLQPQRPSRGSVLVADPDVTSGKATANALSEWGFEPMLVHDGVEAVLTIQRSLPHAAVVDAALPKMFGFQVCELVKRNEQLRAIHVVLVGAIHAEDRYRRAPSELYGADAYVERPQLPEALLPILTGFGLGAAGAEAPAPAPPPAPTLRPPIQSMPAPAPEPAPPVQAPPPVAPEPVAETPAPPVAAPSAPQAPPAAGGDPETEAALAGAERLARIIVSDVVLYNPEKFEAGVRDGNVVDLLHAEIDEGRGLFEQRVDPRVRGARDFLVEELVRVARARGMS
jgi:predicted Zn finger-like uncharacterized protein